MDSVNGCSDFAEIGYQEAHGHNVARVWCGKQCEPCVEEIERLQDQPCASVNSISLSTGQISSQLPGMLDLSRATQQYRQHLCGLHCETMLTYKSF